MDILWQSEGPGKRDLPLARLTTDGEWQMSWGDNEWATWGGVNMNAAEHAIRDELARRLLVERAEQEKLDEHNDGLASRRLEELDKNLAREIEQRSLETKEARRNSSSYERTLADLIGEVEGLKARLSKLDKAATEHLNRMETDLCKFNDHAKHLDKHEMAIADLNVSIETLTKNQLRTDADVALLRDAARPPQGGPLRRAELPAALSWGRTQGIMIDANDQIVLDLSDYFEDGKMSPKDHDLLEKLADLWCAWGAEGYLRDLLDQTRFSPVYMGTPGFRQLRSELLAKPWKEEV